jgi:hypothetical protein
LGPACPRKGRHHPHRAGIHRAARFDAYRAEAATDVLFVAGGLMFGLAALRYQRAFPRHRSGEHPAR